MIYMESSVILDKDSIIKTLHSLTPELHAVYRVKKMGLFGSYVSGTANESSDIDVLAEFEDGADIWDLSGLKIKLEVVFKKPVDITTVSGIRPDMRESILAEVAYS
ncbi:hypothetical protein DLD82_05075 [Methanospirillum stamsii]|uniref:protein adenylyltransferase n=1 Tax=Methanospirillum stamsii TaxID=1277351 RepID=A0A2V2N5Z9_9EURY|nr:hypothetical protein DLD82_05075 [Methanospirillum stamsii]